MLYTIFKNVKQLDLVGLVDNASVLDRSVDYRGHQKFLRSASESLSSINPPPLVWYNPWLAHVFQTMLKAVYNSKLKVTTLKTQYARITNAFDGFSFTFWKPPMRMLQGVKFRSLTTLSLELNCEEFESQNSLRTAGRLFPNVTDVHLRFNEPEEDPASYERMASFFLQALKLEKVVRLSIMSLTTGYVSLFNVIKRLKAVRVLKLERIDLLSEDVDFDEDTAGTPVAWDELLGDILKMAKNDRLEHVHIMYPMQDSTKVCFLASRTAEETVKAMTSLVGSKKKDDKTYRREFTNWTFPRKCGESVAHQCNHCVSVNEHRGFYVCLPKKSHILRYLPEFKKSMHMPDFDE